MALQSLEKIISLFEPSPWQIRPWKDLSSCLLLTGSAGGGKSRLAAEKAHAFAMKYPKSTVLILRKNRDSMTNSTVLFFERVVVGDDPNVVHKPSAHRFEYKNGSIVAYGGMADQKQREQIRSIGQEGGVDFAWLEEATAFAEQDFNEILARMRGRAAPWRQILLSTNPGAPSHWIYQRLIQGGEAKVYYSASKDNPHNPATYIDDLAKISGVQGLRLREGQWVQAEGAVYAEFNRGVHLLERFSIPSDWRKIRSVDFGYSHPFVCQFWAIDPDGRMYLYKEIFQTQTLVEDHAGQIQHLSSGGSFEVTVADHDAEDRATLARHGIPTQAAYKALTPGIQAVQARLRPAGDGKPRLFIFPDSLLARDERLWEAKRPWCTEQEFETYVYPKGQDGMLLKETPIKENDHGMDALRYAVAYVDKLDEQGPRIPELNAQEMRPFHQAAARLWSNGHEWNQRKPSFF